MKTAFLILVALFPVMILSAFLLRGERWGRDRFYLYLSLLVGGAMMTGLVVFVDMPLIGLFPNLFNFRTLLGTTLMSFVCFGLVEELCKMLPVLTFAWRKDETRRMRDSLICCGLSAIGFAAVENVLYVTYSGLAVGILRGILSVPVHFAFGIIMGHYLCRARHEFAEKRKRRYAILSLAVPTFLHGLFDALLLSQILPLMLLGAVLGLGYIVLAFRLLAKARHRVMPETVPTVLTANAKVAYGS